MQGNSPLLVCAMRNSRDTVREGLSYSSYVWSTFRRTNTQSGALRAPPTGATLLLLFHPQKIYVRYLKLAIIGQKFISRRSIKTYMYTLFKIGLKITNKQNNRSGIVMLGSTVYRQTPGKYSTTRPSRSKIKLLWEAGYGGKTLIGQEIRVKSFCNNKMTTRRRQSTVDLYIINLPTAYG